ncbi:Dynactin subunit 2 [Cichlidogyrus casuarinus]|uniref:Dynactin subunit 2 n=1 Tax=Cichlidogyrus casuarinus TaxID=1844966 RepID=A0ABD2Q3H0_9PLAT
MSFPEIDPKYADLPWIAHNQPDVYESGNLPESDQVLAKKDKIDNFDLKSEVHVSTINADEAYKKFSNFVVDANSTDFADVFAGKGYQLYTSYETEKESLSQRLQRLQAEVAALQEDAAKLGDNSKAEADETIKLPEVVETVEKLQATLSSLQLENNFEFKGPSNEAQLLRKVKEQLVEFKSSEGKETAVSNDDKQIIYELYHGLDKQKNLEEEKIASLNSRIQRIEALIGTPDPNRLSILTADTSQCSLLDAANKIAARSALLRGDNLDQVEARLTSLNSKLQALENKKEAIAEADMQKKISELYEVAKKWRGFSESLPLITERMCSLKELHEKASDFNNALVSLEKDQKEMETNLKSYRSMLDNVESRFAESVKKIEENTGTLEKKLQKQ